DLGEAVDVMAREVIPDVLGDDLVRAVAGFDGGPAEVVVVADVIEDAAEVGGFGGAAVERAVGVVGEGRADLDLAGGVVAVGVGDGDQAVLGVVGVVAVAVEGEVAGGVVFGLEDAEEVGVDEVVDELQLVGVGEVVVAVAI
ncbi:MAG: hypothetical protein AAGC72_14190, partial [Planctomycetota bacterium]